MAKTYVMDLGNFLDEKGDFSEESGPGEPFVEFLTAIVSMVSYPAAEPPPEYNVRCQCLDDNGNQCPGFIAGEVMPENGAILWHCPVCNDKGLISNWQGTLWDLSHADIEH